jgi:hypothetical protein
MKAPAKTKATGTSRASKARKSATKSKSPPKARAKAKPGAETVREARSGGLSKCRAILVRYDTRTRELSGPDPVGVSVVLVQKTSSVRCNLTYGRSRDSCILKAPGP